MPLTTHKVSVSEALQMLESGQSLSGFSIDFDRIKVEALDAMKLNKAGVMVPEEAIWHNDEDIVYDEDFEEVKWEGNYRSLKDVLSSKGIAQDESAEVITIELSIKDQEVRDWLNKNTGKLKDIVHKLVVDLYHTDQILHSK